MTKQGILGAFGNHSFLKGLSDQHLMRMASAVNTFEAHPAEYIAWKGRPANCFFLINSGKVDIGNVSDHGIFEAIATVGPGEVVGWSWILPPYRWQFDCRARDTVRGLVIDAEWLRDQCEMDHELGYYILKHLLAVVAERLVATRTARDHDSVPA